MRLALAAFLLLVVRLGAAPLFDVDEGAFSEAPREMLASGDWLSTTLNGRPRFDKPILIYRLRASSVALFGLNEFALRFPSVLAAAVWCALIGRFAATQFTAGTGVAATMVAASSFGVFAIGRAATADALLNLFLAATLFDGWKWQQSSRRGPLLRAYLWMGLGLLTKGPIAVVFPALISLGFFASIRRLGDWLRLATNGWGWLVLLVVAGPWYAAALAIHGRAFVDGFLMHHNVERFTGTLQGHAGSLVYYLVAAPFLLLPWAPALWTVGRRLREDLARPLPRFLWIWFAVVIVFFSLSATKLPHYALYGLTPLFVLLAVRRREIPWAVVAVSAAAWFATIALLPAITGWLAENDRVRDRYYTALFHDASATVGPGYFVLICGLGLLAVVIAAQRRVSVEVRWIALAAASNVALSLAFVPWLGAVLQGPVKQAGLLAREMGESVSTWNFDAPSFSVYRGAVTPSREPRSGEVALTRIDRLPRGVPVDELYRERGVVLVRRR